MSTQVKPEAFFDSLSLAHKLDSFLDGFKIEEIHLFAYFSSILFLYRGNPVAQWQYKFTVDSNGYPFSTDINEAVNRHIRNGLFEIKGDYYTITSRGTDEYNNFKKILKTLPQREEYLNAACTTSILVPYSQTLRALLNDSELINAKSVKDSWLDQMNIYPKFAEISKAVGVAAEDLIIPAVTWINYINEQQNFKA